MAESSTNLEQIESRYGALIIRNPRSYSVVSAAAAPDSSGSVLAVDQALTAITTHAN